MRSSPYQTFFRSLVVLTYAIALCLLYSGYVSIERTLLNMSMRLNGIEEKLRPFSDNPLLNIENKPTAAAAIVKEKMARPHINPDYPNLLTEDPFYTTTLATLLPKGFTPKGHFHQADLTVPDDLHPFTTWANPARWVAQCSVAVASSHFGRYETFAPDMALKIEKRLSPDGSLTEYWVHLREGVMWQPLKREMFPLNIELSPFFLTPRPVTAEDFRFYFDAMMNPWVEVSGAVAMRAFYTDVDSFEVLDPHTFIVRWKNGPPIDDPNTTDTATQPGEQKRYGPPRYSALALTGGLRPLPRFVYQYFANGEKIVDDEQPDSYRTNSVWAHNFNEHWAKKIIVSCGPWIFESLTEEKILFRRNPHHFEPLAALAETMEVRFTTAEEGMWETFKSGSTDFYTLPADRLLDWDVFNQSTLYAQQKAQGNSIHRLDYSAQLYSYAGWNMARPLFKDRRVRQALTLAIDRKRLIEQVLFKLGEEMNGPFLSTSPAYDSTLPPWPFDPRKARFLLEQAGWRVSESDGVLTRIENGIPERFSFALTYYVKSPIGQAVAQFIALSLKEIGVECRLKGVDQMDLSTAFDDRDFDALLLAWVMSDPPEEPKQLWSSKGIQEKGSLNMVSFSNPEADAIMEKLDWEYRPQARISLYHALSRIIYDEAPYTFLYTPKSVLLYRERLQNVWVPAKRQDLIPGANVLQPQPSIYWLKPSKE